MVDPVSWATYFAAGLTGAAAVAATVGGFIAAIAVNSVIAAIVGKILAPDLPVSATDYEGTKLNKVGPVQPRRIIYGETAVGGTIIHQETYGVNEEDSEIKNDKFLRFMAVATHPINQYIGVYFGNIYVPLINRGSNSVGYGTPTWDATRSTWTNDSFWVNVKELGSKDPESDKYKYIRFWPITGFGFADYNYVLDGMSTEALTDRRILWSMHDYMKAPPGDRSPVPVNGDRDTETGLWESGFKGTNCALAGMFISKFDRELLTSPPDMRFHIEGKRLYNPALDSNLTEYGADTNGTHDLNDPDTWEFSDNWALCCLDYMLNIHYGLSIPSSEIDWETMIEAVNDSGELIAQGFITGEEQTRYTVNGSFETSQTPIAIMEALLTQGAGTLIYSQGKYKLRAGVYTAPDSDLDIINENTIIGNLAIQTHVPRSELFNRAGGIYVYKGLEENTLYSAKGPLFEPKDFPLVPLNNLYENQDGEEIIRDFDFPFCDNVYEAQRLAKIYLERARRGLMISFKGTMDLMKYSVGSNIYFEFLSSSKYVEEPFYSLLGLDNTIQVKPGGGAYYKQFKIIEMVYNGDHTIDITMAEEDEDMYDWNAGDASEHEYEPFGSFDLSRVYSSIRPPIWENPSWIGDFQQTTTGWNAEVYAYFSAPEWVSGEENPNDWRRIHGYEVEYGKVLSSNRAGVEFTGGDYYRRTSEALLNFGTNNFSIEFWFKAANDTAVQDIVGKKSGVSTAGWDIQIRDADTGDGYIRVNLNDGSSGDIAYDSTPASLKADGYFHHVVVTFDRTNELCNIYIDNILDSSYSIDTPFTPATDFDNSNQFSIGAKAGGGQYLRSGAVVDEVRLWSGVRTANEVISYTYEINPADHPNLIGYWNLNGTINEITGDLLDSSGNGLTLTHMEILSPHNFYTTGASINRVNTWLSYPYIRQELSPVSGDFTQPPIHLTNLSATPGEAYDVRIRSITYDGRVSAWVHIGDSATGDINLLDAVGGLAQPVAITDIAIQSDPEGDYGINPAFAAQVNLSGPSPYENDDVKDWDYLELFMTIYGDPVEAVGADGESGAYGNLKANIVPHHSKLFRESLPSQISYSDKSGIILFENLRAPLYQVYEWSRNRGGGSYIWKRKLPEKYGEKTYFYARAYTKRGLNTGWYKDPNAWVVSEDIDEPNLLGGEVADPEVVVVNPITNTTTAGGGTGPAPPGDTPTDEDSLGATSDSDNSSGFTGITEESNDIEFDLSYPWAGITFLK